MNGADGAVVIVVERYESTGNFLYPLVGATALKSCRNPILMSDESTAKRISEKDRELPE
jgi:hypothetical protein